MVENSPPPYKINFLEFHEVMRKKNSTNKKKIDSTPPKPPDGGWGWVIVFACFLCNFVVGKQGYKIIFVRL